MLWATMRSAPAAWAAATRWRVPSLRRRSLSAKSRSILRGSMRRGSEVSWWITACGRAHRAGVERVCHGHLGAHLLQRRGALARARHAGHLMPLADEQRYEAAPD